MATVLDISVWGPAYWKTLHACTLVWEFDLTPSTQSEREHTVLALGRCIPCAACRAHFLDMCTRGLRKCGTTLHEAAMDPVRLTKWMVDAHNEVNRRSGKAEVSHAHVKTASYGQSCPIGYCYAGSAVLLVAGAVAAACWWLGRRSCTASKCVSTDVKMRVMET